jgi:hypothetical protein
MNGGGYKYFRGASMPDHSEVTQAKVEPFHSFLAMKLLEDCARREGQQHGLTEDDVRRIVKEELETALERWSICRRHGIPFSGRLII